MAGFHPASIRPSRDDDLAAVAAIYGHHVLHGSASFETEPPSLEEMHRRRAELIARGYPYIVAEDGAHILGYAYAGPYRPTGILSRTRSICVRTRSVAASGASSSMP